MCHLGNKVSATEASVHTRLYRSASKTSPPLHSASDSNPPSSKLSQFFLFSLFLFKQQTNSIDHAPQLFSKYLVNILPLFFCFTYLLAFRLVTIDILWQLYLKCRRTANSKCPISRYSEKWLCIDILQHIKNYYSYLILTTVSEEINQTLTLKKSLIR